MNKKIFNRFGAAALAAIMAASVLSGCGGDDSSSTASSGGTDAASGKEHLDITCYLYGDKPNQIHHVLAEFEKRTADVLNMSLELN